MNELMERVSNSICEAAYFLGLPSPFDFDLQDENGSVSGTYRMAHKQNNGAFDIGFEDDSCKPNKAGNIWLEDWLATDTPLQIKMKAMKSVMSTLPDPYGKLVMPQLRRSN